MAEAPAYLNFWRNAPRSTFEAFRDCAVNLIEVVAAVHSKAKRMVAFSDRSGDMPIFFATGPDAGEELLGILSNNLPVVLGNPLHLEVNACFGHAPLCGRYGGSSSVRQ